MGGDIQDAGRLGWSSICAKLQAMGEQISEEELVHCLEVRKRSSPAECDDIRRGPVPDAGRTLK